MRRIDDHASFAGKAPKGSPCPMGCKEKNYADGMHGGSLSDYPDTEEKIVKDQNEGVRKMGSHKASVEYRH